MSEQTRIEECLERLCQKGCRRVWDDIAALERGEALPVVAGLDAEARHHLLLELKSIMAVYGDRCSLD